MLVLPISKQGGSQRRDGRGRKSGKCERASKVVDFFFISFFFFFLEVALFRAFLLSLVLYAFLSIDAEAARALRRVGVAGGVASLAGDSSATKGEYNNDDDDAPKLATNINLPNDVFSSFSAPPRLLLFLLLLLRVHLGLRGRPEGVRSDDARLCRREQLFG